MTAVLKVGNEYPTRGGKRALITSGPINGSAQADVPFIAHVDGSKWVKYKGDGRCVDEADSALDIVVTDASVAERPLTVKPGYVYEDRNGRRVVTGPTRLTSGRFTELAGASSWKENGRCNDIDEDRPWDLIHELGKAIQSPSNYPLKRLLDEGLWVTRTGERLRVRKGGPDDPGVYVATLHSKSVQYDEMGKAVEPRDTDFDIMHRYETTWMVKPGQAGAGDPGDKKPEPEAPKPNPAFTDPKQQNMEPNTNDMFGASRLPPAKPDPEAEDKTLPHEDLLNAVLRSEAVQMKRQGGQWEDLRNRKFAISMLMTQSDCEFRLKPKTFEGWGNMELLSTGLLAFSSALSEVQAREWVKARADRRLVRLTVDNDMNVVEFKVVP